MPVPHRDPKYKTWRVRFRVDGHHRQETFDTEAQAQRFCADIANRGASTAWEWLLADTADATPTLDTWAGRYFDTLTGASAGTVSGYRSIYRRKWSPTLGTTTLAALSREQIARAVASLPTASDKTLRNWWGVLAAMLKQAVVDGIIPRSPAAGVKLPRRDAEHVEHRYLTHAEFGSLLRAVKPHYRPLVLFLAGTGARFGEAVALMTSDVNLESDPATVRIVKAEKWGRKEVGPTKTRKSKRTVTLPREVADVLAPLCEDRPQSLLFTGEKGGKVHHGVFWSKTWRPALEASGIAQPWPRIHDLRHAHVAWLIAADVPGGLATIQARLGHEKITTTIDTYGHLLPELQVAAAAAASLALGDAVRGAIESK